MEEKQVLKEPNHWKDFRSKVLKLKGPRKHKVRGSIGVYDIYKYIRKNKWFDIGQPITEHQFYFIIRRINELLIESLIEGHDIIFPCRMGTLELRKYIPKFRLVDGKVKAYLPIDWDRTLKLWSEDEEAYKEKTLVKMEKKEIFKVCYNRFKANYNNKAYYEFIVNRDFKRKLKQAVDFGNVDGFLFS